MASVAEIVAATAKHRGLSFEGGRLINRQTGRSAPLWVSDMEMLQLGSRPDLLVVLIAERLKAAEALCEAPAWEPEP